MPTPSIKETPEVTATAAPEVAANPNPPALDPAPVVVPTEARKEKVRVLRTHRTTIAGVVYDLEEGKNVEVPVDVCAILVHSGIVAKI